MCGKIMTVLLIFVVLNCSMARYNGRLHCIVGVLPTCYKRKAATYFYPPGGTGPPLLNQRKEKRKYVASRGIEPMTSDFRVRCPTDCATRPGLLINVITVGILTFMVRKNRLS